VHRPGDARSAGNREARRYTPREAGNGVVMAGLSIELSREEVQAERVIEPRPSTGCKQRNKAFSLHSEVTKQANVTLAAHNGQKQNSDV
jgi:hypothetical protein